MRLVGLPIPKDAQPGEIWAFSDFEGHRCTAMARWNTVVAPWGGVVADSSNDLLETAPPTG